MLGLILWIYGGAQAGFYRTYYEIKKVDEILEIEYAEKVPAFLPGIETLALGFFVFVVLSTLGLVLESKKASA